MGVNKAWACEALKKNAMIMDMMVAGSFIGLMHQQVVTSSYIILFVDITILAASEWFDMVAFRLKEGKPCLSFTQ